MKRFLNNALVTMIIVGALVGAMSVCSYIETHYTREDCVIVGVDGKSVDVEDRTGNVWSYEAEDEVPSVGETVLLKMFTNYTDSNIYDDEIIEVVMHN